MKATGEVMAIDRTFEAALQKAMRSLEVKPDFRLASQPRRYASEHASSAADAFTETGVRRATTVSAAKAHDPSIIEATDARLWRLIATLRDDASDEALEALHDETGIDRWFLYKIRRIVALEAEMCDVAAGIVPALLRRAKRMGFADAQIAQATGLLESEIRARRVAAGIVPVFKMVDTCAGEFAAQTPYYYSTYETENEAPPLAGEKAVVLGSGPIRIGQGIEFDYCSVRSAMALREAGVASIMINSNPETVSTDFDTSDRLYFEPLDVESIMAVLENETIPPVIVQFGGQTAINLADKLDARGVPVLGTSPDRIDLAEDRERFDALMEALDIPRPRGAAVRTVTQALRAAEVIGYPLMVRPSFVLGGRAMEIVRSPESLRRYVDNALDQYGDHPLLIDRYLTGREVEVDAICDGEDVLIPGIMRHIERAGVHSGDSFAVYPALGVNEREVATLVEYTTRMALAMDVRGLINIQFVVTEAGGETAQGGHVFVLEANPRASRTVPFLSKVTGVPIVQLATNIMLGESLQDQGYAGGLWPCQPLVAIKAPVFSMAKIIGAEAALGPEMKSTGEVMGVDRTYAAALRKAFIAAGISLPEHGAAFVSIAERDKAEALPILQRLAAHGYIFYATPGTARFLAGHGMTVESVNRIGVGESRIPELIQTRTVALVINTITGGSGRIREGVEIQDGFLIRRNAVEAGVPCFTSLDTAAAAVELLDAAPDYAVLPIGEYRAREATAAR